MGFETAYKNLEMLSGRNYVATAKALGLSVNDGGEDNDYLRAITQTGFIQNHHLAFSGGTEQSNYRASMSVMNHQMVVRTNNYRNFTAKFDLMQRAVRLVVIQQKDTRYAETFLFCRLAKPHFLHPTERRRRLGR